jgi:hypothetical protein
MHVILQDREGKTVTVPAEDRMGVRETVFAAYTLVSHWDRLEDGAECTFSYNPFSNRVTPDTAPRGSGGRVRYEASDSYARIGRAGLSVELRE